MKASEVFREKLADDRMLAYNPYARFVYDCLRRYEDHHAEEHADCEERGREKIRLMVEAINSTPLLPVPDL